jgi:hypothetical protein
MYTFPFGYAARAIRAVSAGTGEIACGFSDIGVLLVALPGLFLLRFLTSLFLYRQVHRGSPAVSKLVKNIRSIYLGELCVRIAGYGKQAVVNERIMW